MTTDEPIWSRFFSVHPLVLIGSRESDGSYNIAPKHMAIPLSWNKYYGFVCSPSHGTYKNIAREQAFTVSFPKPSQIVITSLAADPRNKEGNKPALSILPTFPAELIDGVFVEDAYLYLECELDRIVEGLEDNCLIIGRIVLAQADTEALRSADVDDQELIHKSNMKPAATLLSPSEITKEEMAEVLALSF